MHRHDIFVINILINVVCEITLEWIKFTCGLRCYSMYLYQSVCLQIIKSIDFNYNNHSKPHESMKYELV